MRRVLLRLAADAILVALMLFLPAGTLAWRRAWTVVAVLLLVRGVGTYVAYRAQPALVRDRARLPVHPEQSAVDRLLVLGVLATGFLGLPLVAALDVVHWHLLAAPPPPVAIAGLGLFAGGWALKSVALRANPFAVGEVRPQHARAQTIADGGVYATVRHPFYAADPLIHVGIGLWLGSWVAVLAAAVPVALMIVRLRGEERFLQRELPAYVAYTERVRYRLVPGLW
jgi:protein-S-isoprenylcysteine O-methyltransferase Ste14